MVDPAILITRRETLVVDPTRVLLIVQRLRTTLVVRMSALGKERSPAVTLEVGCVEKRAVEGNWL
ncbi:uncharacterized protein BT62DRAFT_930230 [Guyanagaster necrorhizus]|uniref:Uncharacterized protein n=1 Tax=Guyanagaster necrorhizus TaxID=856835 RepID=A0A9P7VWE7_9AGAR|nr:uncharacterized protein BT62DRAFT_930230 [Guyanagaster necrorhizus MCA 3950]KAG7448142.1 hypothetical protein BT62DRAFT_930230 [Guyanagaster necrorhizus MCA 3950]